MVVSTDRLLLLSRVWCLAATLAALIIYSGHGSSGLIRMRAFSYLILTLLVQSSVCTLELCGQFISMYLGSTTPVPADPKLFLLHIIADLFMAFLLVGASCSSLGVLTFFMTYNSFSRSVNIRALIHCLLSLVAGALSLFSPYLSVQIARSRQRRVQEQIM